MNPGPNPDRYYAVHFAGTGLSPLEKGGAGSSGMIIRREEALMILAIDTGNTHTVIGCISSEGEIIQINRIESNPNKTEDEYAAGIKIVLEMGSVDLRDLEGAVISSVVPPLTVVLKRAVKTITGIDALVIGAGIRTGLPIMLDDPGTIAADLVATAVAVKEHYPLPCIIIDMGTATTVTVVDQKGRYIGGAILPGVALSMNALTQGTSLLPNIEIIPPNKVIATNTVECMKAGIIFGAAGAIDGVLDRFTESLQATGDDEWSIVATGGLAGTICPYCRHSIILDPDLLLKGLYIIWEKNRGSRRKEKR